MGELIRVLIVDHDDSFRQATCALLEKADCAAATSEARNAQEAIESILQKKTPFSCGLLNAVFLSLISCCHYTRISNGLLDI